MIIVIENTNDNDIGNTAINASRLESTFSVCDICSALLRMTSKVLGDA